MFDSMDVGIRNGPAKADRRIGIQLILQETWQQWDPIFTAQAAMLTKKKDTTLIDR